MSLSGSGGAPLTSWKAGDIQAGLTELAKKNCFEVRPLPFLWTQYEDEVLSAVAATLQP